jgi:hypothetical protein
MKTIRKEYDVWNKRRLLDRFIGLRIPVEMEQKGLDYSEYGLSLSGEEWMEAEPEADSK